MAFDLSLKKLFAMRRRLLGFLVGGLEDDDIERLKQELSKNSQFEEGLGHIRVAVDPLDEDRQFDPPPEGLAQQTCKHVAERRKATGDGTTQP